MSSYTRRNRIISHKKEKILAFSIGAFVLFASLGISHGLIPLDISKGTYLALPYLCATGAIPLNSLVPFYSLDRQPTLSPNIVSQLSLLSVESSATSSTSSNALSGRVAQYTASPAIQAYLKGITATNNEIASGLSHAVIPTTSSTTPAVAGVQSSSNPLGSGVRAISNGAGGYTYIPTTVSGNQPTGTICISGSSGIPVYFVATNPKVIDPSTGQPLKIQVPDLATCQQTSYCQVTTTNPNAPANTGQSSGAVPTTYYGTTNCQYYTPSQICGVDSKGNPVTGTNVAGTGSVTNPSNIAPTTLPAGTTVCNDNGFFTASFLPLTVLTCQPVGTNLGTGGTTTATSTAPAGFKYVPSPSGGAGIDGKGNTLQSCNINTDPTCGGYIPPSQRKTCPDGSTVSSSSSCPSATTPTGSGTTAIPTWGNIGSPTSTTQASQTQQTCESMGLVTTSIGCIDPNNPPACQVGLWDSVNLKCSLIGGAPNNGATASNPSTTQSLQCATAGYVVTQVYSDHIVCSPPPSTTDPISFLTTGYMPYIIIFVIAMIVGLVVIFSRKS